MIEPGERAVEPRNPHESGLVWPRIDVVFLAPPQHYSLSITTTRGVDSGDSDFVSLYQS